MREVQRAIHNQRATTAFVLSLLEGAVTMSSIIKTVSLDENSAKIAKELPNFSHFVRECLYRYASNISVGECTREKTEAFDNLCNPFVQPVCFACWPDGSPPRDKVRQYRQDNLSIDWLQEQAKFANRDMIDLTNVNTGNKTRKTPPPKGNLLQKLLGKLK